MVCFVWPTVVVEREDAWFAEGVAKKELCDFSGEGEDSESGSICVRRGIEVGSQAALQG